MFTNNIYNRHSNNRTNSLTSKRTKEKENETSFPDSEEEE